VFANSFGTRDSDNAKVLIPADFNTKPEETRVYSADRNLWRQIGVGFGVAIMPKSA